MKRVAALLLLAAGCSAPEPGGTLVGVAWIGGSRHIEDCQRVGRLLAENGIRYYAEGLSAGTDVMVARADAVRALQLLKDHAAALGSDVHPKEPLEPRDIPAPSRQAEEDWRRERRQRFVGGASVDDCRKYIRPLLEREGIPYLPWAKDLGLVDIGTDTPENAKRTRDLVRRDAEAHGYTVYVPDDPR